MKWLKRFGVRKYVKILRILVNIMHELQSLWDVIREEEPKQTAIRIEDPLDEKFRKLESRLTAKKEIVLNES